MLPLPARTWAGTPQVPIDTKTIGRVPASVRVRNWPGPAQPRKPESGVSTLGRGSQRPSEQIRIESRRGRSEPCPRRERDRVCQKGYAKDEGPHSPASLPGPLVDADEQPACGQKQRDDEYAAGSMTVTEDQGEVGQRHAPRGWDQNVFHHAPACEGRALMEITFHWAHSPVADNAARDQPPRPCRNPACTRLRAPCSPHPIEPQRPEATQSEQGSGPARLLLYVRECATSSGSWCPW
jgi:hypothetical protein